VLSCFHFTDGGWPPKRWENEFFDSPRIKKERTKSDFRMEDIFVKVTKENNVP
jgi:hypothetical protein